MWMRKIVAVTAIAEVLMCNAQPSNFENINSFSSEMSGSFLPVKKINSNVLRRVDASPKSSAGILLWTVKDGEPHILLGLRDDYSVWSNMGGKAEAEDEWIHVTAAREVMEETMGIYSFAPEELVRMPYLDLEKESSFYRMYIMRCPKFVSSDVFNKKLETAEGSSREYEKFEWISLNAFLKEVNNQTGSSEQSKYPLLRDFVDILCGHEVKSFLKDDKNLQESLSNVTNNLFDSVAQEVIDERKRLANTDKFTQKKKSSSEWNSYPLTPSQSFLKLILGKDYQEGQNRANLETFLKYKKIDADVLTALEKLLDFERQEYEKGNFVGYHGLLGEILFFYRYVSAVNSLLTGRNVYDSSRGLRGNQLPFINAKTKQTYKSAKEVFGLLNSAEQHYGNELSTIFMFINPMLTLDTWCGDTTASSMDFFLKNSSVHVDKVKTLLIEMLILQGMSLKYAEQCYNEFHSLYEQFYGEDNGGMLAISIPEESWNTHMYASGGQDEFLYKNEMNSVSKMLMNIQESAEKLKIDRGSCLNDKCSDEMNEIRKLSSVFRIYLDPSKNFTTFSIWHRNPTVEQQQNLDNAFFNMIDLHIMRLLRSHSRPVKNAFVLSDSNTHLVDRFLSVYNERTNGGLKFDVDTTVIPLLLERGIKDVLITMLGGKKLSPTHELQEAFFQAMLEKHNYNILNWLEDLLEEGVRIRDFLAKEKVQYIKDKVRDRSAYYVIEKTFYPGFEEFLLTIFSYDELEELGLFELLEKKQRRLDKGIDRDQWRVCSIL
jgi:8-oxo-dGTP pyrophosphatase MutT (NUDIX family)